MWVSSLSLVRFRNHRQTQLSLGPGVTLVIGPNGQGKTNIVEGLYYLAFLSSHRVSSDVPLIQQGETTASLGATVHNAERHVTLGLTVNYKGSNKAEVNGSPSPLREMASWLKVVLFSPEDLQLVRGEPSARRRLLDQQLSLQSAHLSATLAEYDRVLRQRNTLLKQLRGRLGSSSEETTLQVWTDALVSLAATITHARRQWISQMGPLLQHHYDSIAPGNTSEMSWGAAEAEVFREMPIDSVGSLESAYRQGFTHILRAERERGQTLLGPHRDDLEFTLNGLPARTHASQGESWSFALSLRLATAHYWRNQSAGGDPILILDDVFSELDHARRETLARHVVDFEQVIITAAVADDIPSLLSGHRYRVERGEVTDDSATWPGESNE